MEIHDEALDLDKLSNTRDAIAYVWENDIGEELTGGERPPSAAEIEGAINGDANIFDTTGWGFEFRSLIKFASETKTLKCNTDDLSDYIKHVDGDLTIGGLWVGAYNNIHLDLQIEAEREDVIGPLRVLLLCFIEKGLHKQPSRPEDIVLYVGEKVGVSFYPKICDIVSNVRIREDIGAHITDEGLPVSDYVNADWHGCNWTPNRAPTGASVGFKPATMQLVKYAEIGGEIVDIREMQITGADLVMQAMADSFGNVDARGKAIIDCEALLTLIMAFPTDVRLSSDDLGAYLIGMPNAKGKNMKAWRLKSRRRVNRALALTRAMYFLEEGEQGVELAKAQAVKNHGEELISYVLGRSRYVNEMMSTPEAGVARKNHAVRLTGRLFRRNDSLKSSPLNNRFINIAEQVISYSGGLVRVGNTNTKIGELLHPKNKDHWMEFTTAEWAKLNGIKHDATVLGRSNSVHSRIYQRVKKMLKEQTKRCNEFNLDTQKDYLSTIEFRKPSTGKVIAFRATDAFRRAHLKPRSETMQKLTLHDLLRVLAEKRFR